MEIEKEDEKTEKPKMKGLKKLLIFIVIVVVIVIALGFIFPGLLWTKDLGVKYTKEDYNSIISKLEYAKDPSPRTGTAEDYEYVYSGVTKIDVDFTSEEITAFLNENRPSYFAVKNVQVRINNDGTVEAVGSANVDYFLNNVLGGKYTKEEIKQEIPALGLLPKNVNLYLKASGSVTDNQSNLALHDVAVQGITIPTHLVKADEAISTVTSGINKMMTEHNTKTGSNYDRISIENNIIKFLGSVPASLERINK